MSHVRPPTINLARRPFRNNSIYFAVFITCGVLLSIASTYNVYDFVVVGRDIAAKREDLSAREQKYLELRDEVERMKKDVSKLDLNTLNQKSMFANGLILSKLFSWSTLFDRIEDLMPPKVKIRSIRPSISAKGGIEIQLDGMANGPEDLYDFESALVKSDYFAAVYPESETTKESRTEINFDLTMKYIPAGKTPQGVVNAKLPSTPTEGLPQSPAGESDPNQDPNQAAAGGPAQTGAPAPGEPPASEGQAPGAAGAGAPAQGGPGASVPQAPQPVPITSESQVVQPAPVPQKPAMLMTNQEFLEALGEERLMRARGKLKPANGGKEPELTNEEFFKKYGKAEFLKERGSLLRDQMNPPRPGFAGAKAPGTAP